MRRKYDLDYVKMQNTNQSMKENSFHLLSGVSQTLRWNLSID